MPEPEIDHTARCTCVPIDGYLIKRQDGCPIHGPIQPRTVPESTPVELTEEQVDLACAWSDYRKDYGVSADHLPAAHKAFLAGWMAAREGDQSGTLR